MGGVRANVGQLIAGAAAASGLTLYLTSPALVSPLTPLAIVLLWLSVWVSKPSMPHPGVLVGLAVITVSALATVPISWLSGAALVPTVWLAVLTLALLPLAWHHRPSNIWPWLVPPALVHAGLAIWQGAVEGMSRAPGLAQNQNAAAAFLALATIYLSTTRYKYFSLPLLVGVAYTGSRWVTLCLAVLLAVIFLSRNVNWRWLLVGIAAAMTMLAAAQPTHLAAAYRVVPAQETGDTATGGAGTSGVAREVSGTISGTVRKGWEDIRYRLQADIPSLVPRGFYDPKTAHNVPLRMALETGLLSGLAWVALTGWALWQYPRLGAGWWMLLALASVSMMDYYTWIGPLGGFWWLLVGERLQRRVDGVTLGAGAAAAEG